MGREDVVQLNGEIAKEKEEMNSEKVRGKWLRENVVEFDGKGGRLKERFRRMSRIF